MSKRKQHAPEQVKELHTNIGALAVANDFCPESSSRGPASEVGDG